MYRNIGGSAEKFSNNKVLFWLAVIVAFIGFVWTFSEVCFSFFSGFILAYIFAPLIDKISKYVNRTLSSLILVIGIVYCLAIIIIKGVPLIVDYTLMLSNNAPAYLRKISELLSQFGDSVGIPYIRESLQNAPMDMLKYVDQKTLLISSLAKGIVSQCYALTGAVSFFIIMTLSFFYFSKDWNSIKMFCYRYIPIRQQETFRAVGKLVRRTLQNFLQGQFCVVIVLSIYYGGCLMIGGINNFIALGITSGLFSFIPFIGAILALLIVIFINATTLSLTQLYGIVALYISGQFIEGYILSPKLVGKTTGLHPLWILFSFFAGYQIKGIIGVLIAIPFTSIMNSLIIFALNKFRESQAYKQ